MPITQTDRGYRNALRAVRKMSRASSVVVGVQGDEAVAAKSVRDDDDSAQTVGEVAAAHELGLGVPERSWLRGWVDENERMIRDDLARVAREAMIGTRSVDDGMELLGLRYVGLIQARIAAGIPPELHLSTVARKGSAIPLIDTGQLRSAITAVLSEKIRGDR